MRPVTPDKDVEASSTAGRCLRCLRALDDHSFKVTDSWRGKSTPEGNAIWECTLTKNQEPPQSDAGDQA